MLKLWGFLCYLKQTNLNWLYSWLEGSYKYKGRLRVTGLWWCSEARNWETGKISFCSNVKNIVITHVCPFSLERQKKGDILRPQILICQRSENAHMIFLGTVIWIFCTAERKIRFFDISILGLVENWAAWHICSTTRGKAWRCIDIWFYFKVWFVGKIKIRKTCSSDFLLTVCQCAHVFMAGLNNLRRLFEG